MSDSLFPSEQYWIDKVNDTYNAYLLEQGRPENKLPANALKDPDQPVSAKQKCDRKCLNDTVSDTKSFAGKHANDFLFGKSDPQDTSQPYAEYGTTKEGYGVQVTVHFHNINDVPKVLKKDAKKAKEAAGNVAKSAWDATTSAINSLFGPSYSDEENYKLEEYEKTKNLS